ncbi:MAG: glycosyltransferase family 1 protein [Bacilli bacterium]|nr:glycosyltransferase family 1 protein [Bacilli bacterium]
MDNQPITIAHIVGKWVGGGVESVIMTYYRNIDHNKIQFHFICDDDSTDIPYKEIEKLGGKVILIPPYQKPFKYHKKLKKILEEGNYKIVHSHINTMSVFPLFAAKCAGVPIRIVHNHSTTNKKELIKNMLKQILKPFSKVFSTHYFACTEHAGRWLFGDKTFDKGNVYVLNNAIDLDKFKYNENLRAKKRKELDISDDTIVIGHVGRFMKQKNHSFLIELFSEIHKKKNDSVLLLVGQGPLMGEIKDKVNALGLTDNVKFLGQRNDVNELYQAFDVFCLPSLYEGLGIVLIEAQCAGSLCFCSSEVPDVAKVTDNLQFIDLNLPATIWSKKILENININKRKDHVKDCQKAGYDINIEVKKLEEKYIELLEGK